MGTKDIGQAVTFAAGDKVQLIAEPPDYAHYAHYAHYALTACDRGTVEFTDSVGTTDVRWDSGVQVGIIAELAGLLRKAES